MLCFKMKSVVVGTPPSVTLRRAGGSEFIVKELTTCIGQSVVRQKHT